MAESTTGGMRSAEAVILPKAEGNPLTAEEVGEEGALLLLQEEFKVQ